ncbi:MAG: 3-deoxy-D-manno-octulosonic acid transferase [Thermodesulfobacteriota bacterium]
MNLLDATYKAAACALASAGFPAFWLYTRMSGRYRRGLEQRFGFVSPAVESRLSGSPRIWIHAVSLGEIRVAYSLVRALDEQVPGCSVLVSTTTDHGFDLARETFGRDFPLVYAPVDLPFSVRRALQRVRPRVLVFLETELWPAWIAEARALGIRTALVNGRISPRSFEGYRRFRFFFRNVLSRIDAFSMIGEEDARRVRALGAEARRVLVNGNAKYDLLPEQVGHEAEALVRRILNIDGRVPVFVAGSTRSGEERPLLDAYDQIRKAFPDTLLVIAPRHIERAREISELVRRRGLGCQFRSELRDGDAPRSAPVVILDTFGELFRFYSAATLVFCGASLVPLGGQNPMEPAAWGKPVFYGPSMEDFSDATALLEDMGANGMVTDAHMLAREAVRLLKAPAERKDRGEKARRAVLGSRSAARRHAQVVVRLLSGGS